MNKYIKEAGNLYSNSPKFDINIEIGKVISTLNDVFYNIDVEYKLDNKTSLIFTVSSLANLKLRIQIVFDLEKYDIRYEGDLERIIFPLLYDAITSAWSSIILRSNKNEQSFSKYR